MSIPRSLKNRLALSRSFRDHMPRSATVSMPSRARDAAFSYR